MKHKRKTTTIRAIAIILAVISSGGLFVYALNKVVVSTTTNVKQQVTEKQLPVVSNIEPVHTNKVTGSFTTEMQHGQVQAQDEPLAPSTLRTEQGSIQIVDSFNAEPPLDAIGVWQGSLDFSRNRQIFLVGHSGVYAGSLIAGLTVGKTFEVTDVTGTTRKYEVAYTRDLDDYGFSAVDNKDYYKETVDSKEDRIVLQTCYSDDLNYMVYAYPQ